MLATTTLMPYNSPIFLKICPNFTTQPQNSSNFLTIPTHYATTLRLYGSKTLILQKSTFQISPNSIVTTVAQCATKRIPIFSNTFKDSLQSFVPEKGTLQISRNSIVKTVAQCSPKRISFFSKTLRDSLHCYKIFVPEKGNLQICQSSIDSEDLEGEDCEEKENGGNESGAEIWEWTSSGLLLLLWGGLLYYVFNLAPSQTPSRDIYFLEKLLNLRGDDGFRMNQVLVSLWYIMGLWPLAYSMLLLPSARSSKSKIPLWPFLILSCFGGAYALIPYFVLWKPPSLPVKESELEKWPLNFLESKITAAISLVAGLGLITYAGLANGEDWKEFIQYFRESKFIHATSIDFTLLSTFAPFWVYNDMTARKWYDKGFWLIPLSLIPFLGPTLYVLLRPSLDLESVKLEPSSTEN